jgi:hypothetical protein
VPAVGNILIRIFIGFKEKKIGDNFYIISTVKDFIYLLFNLDFTKIKLQLNVNISTKKIIFFYR